MKQPQTWEDAERVLPGGVNSANRRVEPRWVITAADGAHIEMADGGRYVDYHVGFGPIILGHRHPAVEGAVRATLDRLDFVATGVTDVEIDAAERLVAAVPSIDRVLFTNSGSEATYAAIRLARAHTGRRKLIKFQGCYHGWHDSIALNVISTREHVGAHDPLSAGSSPHELADTIVCRFNDLDDVAAAFAAHDGDIAAVILEPIPHNIGALMPIDGFLAGFRKLTSDHGALLIFDEVITGIRHGLGGYQEVAGVMPDLTTLGKAIANGWPAAAVGGPAALMDEFSTAGGPVFFAGTFNGHPASMAAVAATLDALADGAAHRHMFALGDRIRTELQAMADAHGIPADASGFGSVFCLYFLDRTPVSYDDLLDNDDARYVAFHRGLIERGHYLFPQALKRSHLTASHTAAQVDHLLDDADQVLKQLASQA